MSGFEPQFPHLQINNKITCGGDLTRLYVNMLLDGSPLHLILTNLPPRGHLLLLWDVWELAEVPPPHCTC